AAMQAERPVLIGWLVLALALLGALEDVVLALRGRAAWRWTSLGWPAYGLALVLALAFLPLHELPMLLQAVLTLAAITPLGPLMYRLFFQPVAHVSGLLLMIIAIAVHVSLLGVGLLVFGAEGSRTAPFSEASLDLGTLSIASQTIWVLLVSLALILSLYVMFERTLYGKALRATALQ
ncbi:hypothetical protein ACQV5M_20885, partial [Leptospira sp. SA-E8]|uniref:hypothetical protein n=1 Tax=Leptospira sp. SA-E8 TaxID=3422259 RepID=UPI003EBB810E